MDYFKESLKMHEERKGKMEISSKVLLESIDDLSVSYTPGVAEPCKKIAEDKEKAYRYTIKGNSVAVVTDGSAVLGLGNIGALAGLPVMEGKCLLFKKFANVDAYPICLETQDEDEIVEVVKNIAPGFGGINLEDIKAPKCFAIERRLQEALDIPVFHDDQHGTAIVTLAALINSLKVTDQKIEDLKFIFSGAGAAGVAIAKLLYKYGAENIIMCDSQGIISSSRKKLGEDKKKLLEFTNKEDISGSLKDGIKGRDVFIGVSAPGIVDKEMISSMNKNPWVFAMANPTPEIMPDEARKGGAKIIATGRSDFPNQINNVLAFPGIFRGLLDARIKKVTDEIKIAAAEALANLVENPTEEKIVPYALEKGVADEVAKAVKKLK